MTTEDASRPKRSLPIGLSELELAFDNDDAMTMYFLDTDSGDES